MSASSPHNKIINAVARAKLKPLDIQQKGRSRLWYDDQKWHAISVEFQPSGFGKGSYLNVAISWLWYPKDFWSFDFSYDRRSYVEFENEVQFQRDFEVLANEAVNAVQAFRTSFSSLRGACEILLEDDKDKPRPGGWPDVHTGLLAGLNGHAEQAEGLLRYVAEQENQTEWQGEQSVFCDKAISLLGNRGELRSWVEQNIVECRSLMGLPLSEAPNLPDS